jgi:preprotein translocase subunit SecB
VQTSGIKCESIFLAEALFRLNGAMSAGDLDGEYNIRFDYEVSDASDGKLQTSLILTASHKQNPKKLDLRLKVMGLFSGDPAELEAWTPYSPAMLLPYMRTYVSTLTGWGPMKPLLLPLMSLTDDVARHREGRNAPEGQAAGESEK